MDAEKVDRWQPVIRDLLIDVVATFLAVFGAIFIHEATVLTIVLGASLALFGVPPVLHIREQRRMEDGNQKDNDDQDERWSHLP